MVEVSKNYYPYNQTRHVDMEIEFDVTERDAINNYTLSVNNQETISNIYQLRKTDYIDRKYATCESNMVRLDGTWRYMPDELTTQQIGWWSTSISNQNREFTTNPTLTATFTNKYSCVGFTITSSKTNPISECKVTCYNDNTLIYNEVFESDNHIIFADIPVNEFNKVIVEVIKTKEPYRRVKILSFAVGILKVFNKNDIVTATITEETSINSQTLPINELSFEIYDPNKYFGTYYSDTKYVYRSATKHASISSTNSHSLSRENQLNDFDKQLYKYATCEDNYVRLDGTYRYLPDSSIPTSYQIGYINSTISDEEGTFSNIPTITYSWNTSIDFSGLEICFVGDSYAREINVELYNGNSLIHEQTFNNNDSTANISFGSHNCTSIVMSFNKMNKSYRHLKISEIHILRNAETWSSYITKGRNIKANIIIDGEEVNVGNNYMFNRLDQSHEGLTTTIVAKDYISKLDRQHCPAGSNTTTTLDNMLTTVLNNSGISVRYWNKSIKNTTIRRTVPKDTSKRAAIHYLTQAAKATCFLDRNKILHVRPLGQRSYVDTLDMNNIYKSDIMRLDDYVNMIRLSVPNPYIEPEPEPERYYGGSGYYYREIENSCVYPDNGQAVADWLLTQAKRRMYFEMETRGNPALEIGDTVKIQTRDGTIYFAVVFYQQFEYNGGLKSTIKAII